MKKVIISPFSRELKKNKKNPKNFPWWGGVISMLKNHGDIEVIQIGAGNERELWPHKKMFDLPYKELKKELEKCDTWASVDNFCPHLAHLIGKKVVVIFGKSDPKIFGYQENINLLKDRKHLMKNQFVTWDMETFDEDVFVTPKEVYESILSLL